MKNNIVLSTWLTRLFMASKSPQRVSLMNTSLLGLLAMQLSACGGGGDGGTTPADGDGNPTPADGGGETPVDDDRTITLSSESNDVTGGGFNDKFVIPEAFQGDFRIDGGDSDGDQLYIYAPQNFTIDNNNFRNIEQVYVSGSTSIDFSSYKLSSDETIEVVVLTDESTTQEIITPNQDPGNEGAFKIQLNEKTNTTIVANSDCEVVDPKPTDRLEVTDGDAVVTVYLSENYVAFADSFDNSSGGYLEFDLVGDAALFDASLITNTTGIEVDSRDAASTIIGTIGNDIIIGGEGVDTLSGGDGDDTIEVFIAGDGDEDIMDGGDGTDTLQLNWGTHEFAVDDNLKNIEIVYLADDEDDTKPINTSVYLADQTEDFTIFGDVKDDIIYGGAGNDFISGGAGIDTIAGGAGNDTIFGGEGNDKFKLDGSSNGGTDTITDFDTDTETIDLITNGAKAGTTTNFGYSEGALGNVGNTVGLAVFSTDITVTDATTGPTEAEIQTYLGSSEVFANGATGDAIYIAADNGTNTYLMLLTNGDGNNTFTAADDTGVVLAVFEEISDATSFSNDNWNDFA